MILNFFSSRGWQSWDVEHRPLIPEGMPVLNDDDLRFEDGPAAPRPTAVVNRWLRELPASGAPAPSSWENYARVSMRTLEYLVTGHYRQAAKLVRDTDADAALVFYLSKADPLLVLRDLLGQTTVLTTEKYLRRLDTTRIFRDAYEGAGAAAGLTDNAVAEREVAAEFTDDFEDGAI